MSVVIITAVCSAHLRAGSARQTRAPSPQTPAPPRSCPTRGRPPPGGSARDPRPPASAAASPGLLPHLRPPAVWAGQLVLVFQSSSRFPQSSDSLHSPCFLKIICECCSFVSDIYTLDLLEDSEAGEAHAELLVRSGARYKHYKLHKCQHQLYTLYLEGSTTLFAPQLLHTTRPHRLQWCRRTSSLNTHVSTLLDTCQHD